MKDSQWKGLMLSSHKFFPRPMISLLFDVFEALEKWGGKGSRDTIQDP